MFIEDMTWEEIKNEMDGGKKNVLVMIGAMEQHGPHLPLNTDTLDAYIIARGVAHKLGNALVAPVLSLGCSKYHMSFPGTISLTEKTFQQVLREVCISLDKHGFRNIIIITTHGGNMGPIENALKGIRENVSAKIIFVRLDDFDDLVDTAARKFLGNRLDDCRLHSCHACLHETSAMLYRCPEKVRKSKIVAGRTKPFDHKELLEKGDVKEFSPNGILGDPTLASKELGKIFEEIIIDADVQKIRELLSE
jgi:creatinine amidohydrolase